MPIEYRPIRDSEFDGLASLESVAFYGRPNPEDGKFLRKLTKPEWTLAAFDDGKPIASVRSIPSARLMHGTQTPFALISPVTCQAAYRRQGHVAKLLRQSLELMKERGQPISGLYTPHDALYRRYGWERAEEKRRLNFDPGQLKFRTPTPPGKTRPATQDDWRTLDAIYRERVDPLNGALVREEDWWRFAVMADWQDKDRRVRDIVVWADESGEDRGYVVYQNRPTGQRATDGWPQQEIWVRDFVALDADAYRGLWQHILTHDLASNVVYESHPGDPFVDLCEDPFVVTVKRGEGPMIRIADVEGAIASRPYAGGRSASFTMRISDESAPWNEGVWRVDAAEGKMRAEKTDAAPDVEMSVNFLAPLYSGFRTAEALAAVGMITVHRAEALAEITNAFAVVDPPFTQDYY